MHCSSLRYDWLDQPCDCKPHGELEYSNYGGHRSVLFLAVSYDQTLFYFRNTKSAIIERFMEATQTAVCVVKDVASPLRQQRAVMF